MRILYRLLVVVFSVFNFYCHSSQDFFEESFNKCKKPVFYENEAVNGHIFRKEIGHFSKDTNENRSYILASVSNPNYKVATNKQNVDLYFKIMPDVLKFLCKAGCDARRARTDGYTPLHIAAEEGWEEGLEILLDNAAYLDINAKTKFGATALRLAEENQHCNLVKLLKQCGAT